MPYGIVFINSTEQAGEQRSSHFDFAIESNKSNNEQQQIE